MCGIAGIFDSHQSSNNQTGPMVDSMLELMRHRGPDDKGRQSFPGLELGHLRLSILDLSPRGHQPMSAGQGRYWISYNGEVYNYLEMRRDLESLGHRFKSETDTEVILRAYMQWGLDCFSRFNGMWALAIYDAKRRSLILSRDRVGIKPLYWRLDGERLEFASEIKALLANFMAGGKEIALDPMSLQTYLNSGLVDGLEDTFFKGIKRFKPGHFMVVENGRIQSYKPYWDLPAIALGKKDELRGSSFDELSGQLFDTLQDALAKHVRSDVPVGVCLSGGLDSSCVAGMASKHIQDLNAFTIWFKEGDEFNELPHAAKVSEGFGLNWSKKEVPGEELIDKLPNILWYLDEPTLAMGVYPQWHVMEDAARKVKVVMDGQGGDEIFAGYDFYAARLLYSKLCQGKTKDYQQVLGGYYQNYGIDKVNALGQEVKGLFFNNAQNQAPRAFEGHLDNFLLQELTLTRLPALLRYEDRLSMAFSIESRVPLLDHRLIEFAFALDEEMKVGPGWSKHIFRQALDGFLPSEVTWRKDKKGFPTPFELWADGIHAQAIRELLTRKGSWMARLLDEKAMPGFFQAWGQGQKDPWRLWRFLSLELWLSTYLERLGKELSHTRAQAVVQTADQAAQAGCSQPSAEIVVTMDYETFDTNDFVLGPDLEPDWQTTVMEPTERFASLLEKHGIPLTVMWNVPEYFWLKENGHGDIASAIESQLKGLVQRGHDVQLHLHPAWASVRKQGGRWIWGNPGLTAPGMDPEAFEALVAKSVETMEGLFQPIRPDYKVRGFRGRSYEVEPFSLISDALDKHGIKADSSYHGQGPVMVRRSNLTAQVSPKQANFLEYPILSQNNQRWDFSGPPQFASFPLQLLQGPPQPGSCMVMIGHCKQAIHFDEIDRCLAELKARFSGALKGVRWQDSIESRLNQMGGDWMPDQGFSAHYFEQRWQENDPFHSQALDDPYYTKLLGLLPQGASSLLDLGCAEGDFTSAMAERMGVERALGVDISAQAVERARQSHTALDFQQKDLKLLALDERFDCIVSSQNIYYFTSAERCIHFSRMESMLAPEGQVILAWWTGARRGYQEEAIEEEFRRFFRVVHDETHHAGSLGTIKGDHRILVGERRLNPQEERLLGKVYWQDKKVYCQPSVRPDLKKRFAWKCAQWLQDDPAEADVVICTEWDPRDWQRLRAQGTVILLGSSGKEAFEDQGALWVHQAQGLSLGAKLNNQEPIAAHIPGNSNGGGGGVLAAEHRGRGQGLAFP